MPPFSARSVPVLMKLPSPSVGSSVSVPPLTLAVITPAFLITVWLRPMLPWPCTVWPLPKVITFEPLSAKRRVLPAFSVIVPVPLKVALFVPCRRKSESVPIVMPPLLTIIPEKYVVWLSASTTVPVFVMAPLLTPSSHPLLARTICPPEAVLSVPPLRTVPLVILTVPLLIALSVPLLTKLPPVKLIVPLSARMTPPLVPPDVTVSAEPVLISNTAFGSGVPASNASVWIESLPTSCVMVFVPVTVMITSLPCGGGPSGVQFVGNVQRPLVSFAQVIVCAGAPMEASASASAVSLRFDLDANAMKSPDACSLSAPTGAA